MKIEHIIVGVLVLALLGIINIPGISGMLGSQSTGSMLQPASAGTGCPTSLATTIKTRASNPLNSTLNYVAVPLSYVSTDTGKVAGTDTGVSSDTGTWSTGMSLTCGKTYKAEVINSASYAYATSNIGKISGDVTYNEMSVTPSGQLVFALYDSTLNNQSAGSADGTEGAWVMDAASTAQTFGASAGMTRSYVLKAKVNATAAQFGSDSLPPYICIDFDTAVYSKANGVIISGVNEAPISAVAYCAANGYDKAYALPGALKSTNGEYSFNVQIKNDLGAASNKDIKFLFVDQHAYLKNDGTIGYGTANDNLAAVGETDNYLTFNDD